MKMKYVIMCGGFYEYAPETPKQMSVVNGERLVDRTIRLLKENGAKDIYISSNDKRFDDCGVERLEHENTYRFVDGKLTGYWLDAFYPHFKKTDKVTYLFGDVYYTDEAIKKIVQCDLDGNILFGTGAAKNEQHKNWGEPFAYVVNDYKTFMDGVVAVKKLQDEGKLSRVAIVWELYRYLNDLDVNVQAVKDETYIVIDDDTSDIDAPWQVEAMNKKIINKRQEKGDSMYSNIFYFRQIYAIGGIENFFYQLAKKYCDYDITIIYDTGDFAQIRRLAKFVRVIKNKGQKFKCKKAFFNYNIDIINNVEAEEYIQILHGDYKAMGIKPPMHPKINRYIGISKTVCDSFKDVTGKDAELCYNPFTVEKTDKALTLISATRFTTSKGTERMEKLANTLDKAGVKYIWFIFSNAPKEKAFNKKVVILPPELDIIPYIKAADYLVQLSSNEGYGYSVVEALSSGTPVIATPCPVFEELGMNEKNSIIVDFDMKNIPIDKIKKGLPKFKYTPPKDNWEDLIAKEPSTYDFKSGNADVSTEVIKNYTDMVLNRYVYKGERLSMPADRAAVVEAAGYIRIIGY